MQVSAVRFKKVAPFLLIVVTAMATGISPKVAPAHASIDRIYTLPFYSSYSITCPFGPYANCPPNPFQGNHLGTDYGLGTAQPANEVGEVIAAAAKGTVRRCPYQEEGFGNYVIIDHKNGHRAWYGHFFSAPLPGDSHPVIRGQIIGNEGSTGRSTGPHLHFETWHGVTSAFDCTYPPATGTVVDPYGGPYSPNTWLWEDQPPGGQPPNHADFAPAIASYCCGRVDIFVRGKSDGLWQRTRDGNGAWGGWSRPFGPGGTCLRSAPAVTTWSTTRLDVFVRGCDNAIWQVWWDGSWHSHSLLGCTLGAPGASSWGTNRIDVFVRGCDNVLYQNAWTGSSWTGWIGFGGTCLRSGPGAVSWGYNRIDLVYRGCDDTIRHRWWNGSGWLGESFGGCTMVAPAIASWGSPHLDVFHRGCGPADYEGIFQKSWNGSSWSAWTDRGGCLASAPGTDAWAPDWLDVPYRGCDSSTNLYNLYWNGGAWAHAFFSHWP